ncbi:phage tail protein [Serratia sp. Tan611]|uniref:phage tail protein n=1 Tax=Serratia sp. Tan611 TaxID=2773264 RepID=UPI0019317228|nr:phage tail protein [Serratia sp. Tan611]CAE1144952.1 Phage tail protein [Serratia sp. Tan611]
MNEKKFTTIITDTGAERLAKAAVDGTPLAIKEMGVGDGGGQLPTPRPDADKLVNELYRGALNKLVIADNNASIIEAELIMPPTVGGFWLREIALFADDGACIAIGNMPETYKPKLHEGSARFQVIRMQIKVSSTADVELIADPSIVLATVEETSKARDEAKDYTDQVAESIGEDTAAAINAAVEKAIREAWELDNPIGTSRLFNSNIDPNTRWPWSTWEYAGEHVTVRTAAADGSDVGAFGGSDTVNIARGNLPTETIGLSGTTEEHGAQTLQTKPAGKHAHMAGVRAPGAEYSTSNIGTDADQPHKLGWTSDEGEHVHEYDIPAHRHPFSGRTENLGNGQPLQIVERHKLQMLWHRVE